MPFLSKKSHYIDILKDVLFRIPIPKHIRKNFKEEPLSSNNKENCHIEFNKSNSNKDDRLENFRNKLIPWLDSIRRIKGLRVLEIGCGPGSSTIAFSEQSAIITAIDVNEDFLHEAKTKCYSYGLQPLFFKLNASEIDNHFPSESFDLIIFMASLEHMTLPEREKALAAAYKLLPKGGLLCITGSPNRLHFMDSHTSLLPFFHWLPDELAIKYAKYSSRAQYNDHLLEVDDNFEKLEWFYRWGRGVSFHEIEIALKPLNELKIVGDLTSFLRRKNFIYAITTAFTTNFLYEKFFIKKFPNINKAFFRPYIDIVIEK